MLYGRARERDQIAERVAGARSGRSFATLLEGPAGIGKSTLLEEAAAAADGMLVLRAAGHESESEIPYAGLSELLAPVLHLRERLPDGQRAALGGAVALEPAAPRDRFAVGVALLGLLAAAAEQQPLLVLLDDAHWLDEATRDAVLFAAQRLVAEGVGVLLAAREADGVPIAAPGLERLALGPLDRDDGLALLRESVPLSTEVAEALLSASGGNPLALRELPRALTPEQRAGRAPLNTPPAPGGEVQAAFARELAALPEPTRGALCVVAAGAGVAPVVLDAALERFAGGGARGAGVGARGGGASGTAAGAADLAPALAAGIVVERAGRIAFRHPLLAAAAYHAAPSGERRAAHGALAAVLTDAPRRAWQLSAAALGPDPDAVAALRAAGEEARGRGAHAEAARAFARGAELAAAPRERAALELEGARDHALAGHGELALELANRVADAPDAAADPAVQAGAEHLRAHLAMRGGAPAEATRALEQLARRAAEAGDQAGSARFLLEASLGHMFEGDMEALLEVAARARAQAEGVADELALLASLVSGEALLALGRSAEGDALIAAAEPLLFAADPLSEIAEVIGMGAMTSLWVERFDRVERTVGRMVSLTRDAGAASRLVYPLCVRSQLQWRRGRWAAAYADAEESVRLAQETGQRGALALSLAALSRAEAGIGRTEEARAHGEEGAALAAAAAGAATRQHALAALGFAELTAGRAEAAAAWLEEADATDVRLGHGEPALTMYAADLVEALVRAGRRDDAERALARMAAGAERTGGAWANAAVERGRVLLAEASELERHGAAAAARHARVEMPFERARSELVLGERLRRARRRADARGPLERALRAFEQIGAEPWAQRARTELRATGGPAGAAAGTGAEERATAATPVAELTPHELQVALLVAEGRTNRDVGSALFLSPKTIEHHLSAIYRKLGLRSRAQLAAAMAGQTPSPAS